MFDQKKLSENIRKFRTAKGITQTDLAELLHISPQSVSKWECGATVPDIENLCMMAEKFGVPVDLLLGCNVEDEKIMIGIDGGGTKTEFVLFNDIGTILERLKLGPCNPNAVGLDNSIALLKKGIDDLLATHSGVCGIYIGASGFLTGGNGKKIENSLKTAYPQILIQCETDITNVIASATSAENCAAVICGTGSVVFAKEKDKLTQITGWGYLLSRGGSGYDIGRDALLAALEDDEGIGEHTLLTALVGEMLDGPVKSCVSQIYRKDQSYGASFAPLVFAAFEMQDAVAARILSENAKQIASVINYTLTRYDCQKRVILAGGLLANRTDYLAMVKEYLQPDITVITPKTPQVLGACRLCAKMCGVDSAELMDILYHEYCEGE